MRYVKLLLAVVLLTSCGGVGGWFGKPVGVGFGAGGLSFDASEGGADPAAQPVTIDVTPDGLDWTASTTETWLAVSLTSGNGDATLTVSISVAGLTEGVHTAQLVIDCPATGLGPFSLGVTVVISPPYSISGTVSGDVQAGVTVALSGDATGSTVSAGDGSFSFGGLSNGTYTVTPNLAGYSFAPASRAVTVAGADETGVDFTATATGGPAGVWYVRAGGTGDGTSWATAFGHPQDAVDAASAGEEVWIAEGTYVRQGSDTILLTMKDGVSIYGGFAGTETNRGQRDPATHVTTLDGEMLVYHVVVGADNATLDGFTITRGNASGSGATEDQGGGMFNSNIANLTVSNCIFSSNSTEWPGGGMFNDQSSPVVMDCTFDGNSATSSGYGGGMANWTSSSPSVSNCRFSNNSASFVGGGMENYSFSSPTIVNCVFWNNSAGSDGGALHFNGWCTPTIENCTFYGNTGGAGDCISNWDDTNALVTNCILWNGGVDEITNQADCTCTVGFSNVQGGYAGTNNIDLDPLFVDAAGGDFHLSAGSPCIDAADGDAAPATDILGNARHDDPGIPNDGIAAANGAHPDMGAYEFQGDSTGTYKIVDLTTGFVTDAGTVRDLLTNADYKTTKLVLKRIEAGSFSMGDETSVGEADELPVHTVNITQPFYMGVFEVTQRQWFEINGDWPSFHTTTPDMRPVEQVSWADCQSFLTQFSAFTAATFRLPTEAEWEYCCKTGTSTNYSYGDTEDGAWMWYDANATETRDVASTVSKPNPWGLYDMHGNVWEWCSDWYDSMYYAVSPGDDPQGPASGGSRVLRGGGWFNCGGYLCRSANRNWGGPTIGNYHVGLRAVLAP